jgi:ectoine hydroxylase-related dioxygenase (phytanoyl-CoA dioxygenase family)
MRSTGQPALGVQVLWLLDDFTEENGGTMFYPGSHLVDGCPPDITPGGSERPPLAMVFGSPRPEPAGTVLIAHSSWWHRQTNNTTRLPRTALLGNYVPGFVVAKDPMERQWTHRHEALDQFLPNQWSRDAFRRLWLGKFLRGLFDN